MNIVFDARVLESSYKTGIAWYAHQLLHSLIAVRSPDQVHVLFNSLRRSSPDAHLPADKRVHVHIVKLPVVLVDAFNNRFWFDAFLPAKLEKIECDVFHGVDFAVPPAGSYGNIVTIHDLQKFINPELMKSPGADWYWYWTKKSLHRATRVIVPSAFVRGSIEQHFPQYAGKVRVVHHGVDAKHFRPIVPEQITAFRRAHGLPEQYILFVGALNRRKNIVVLIQAYARLKKAGRINCGLVLAGGLGHTSHDEIMKVIKDSGVRDSIMLYGYAPQEDLPYLYNGASAFVFPSLHEGFGLPVLEAMACGVPVIASAVTSLPEVVGDAGILFDPTSEEELAEALHTVLTDTARADALRARGFERIKQFTWEATARKTMDVYREAVEEHAHA